MYSMLTMMSYDVIFHILQVLKLQVQQNCSYQEGTHWKRIKPIGSGGSATTYCIQDLTSDYWLALKEVGSIGGGVTGQ